MSSRIPLRDSPEHFELPRPWFGASGGAVGHFGGSTRGVKVGPERAGSYELACRGGGFGAGGLGLERGPGPAPGVHQRLPK